MEPNVSRTPRPVPRELEVKPRAMEAMRVGGHRPSGHSDAANKLNLLVLFILYTYITMLCVLCVCVVYRSH